MSMLNQLIFQVSQFKVRNQNKQKNWKKNWKNSRKWILYKIQPTRSVSIMMLLSNVCTFVMFVVPFVLCFFYIWFVFSLWFRVVSNWFMCFSHKFSSFFLELMSVSCENETNIALVSRFVDFRAIEFSFIIKSTLDYIQGRLIYLNSAWLRLS